MYGFLAVVTLLLHLGFVLFCTLGGALVLWRWRIIWWHLPALAWGATMELGGYICPLTYLENYFLRQAGQAGYTGDFVAQYLLAVIYPEGLTRSDQILLGGLLLSFNAAVYLLVWRRRRTQ